MFLEKCQLISILQLLTVETLLTYVVRIRYLRVDGLNSEVMVSSLSSVLFCVTCLSYSQWMALRPCVQLGKPTPQYIKGMKIC